jgi:hypothetical protein
MRSQLSIWFCDFWPNFDPDNNYFINLFRKHYDIILDDANPDFLIFSVFGFKHLNYFNAVRIQFIAENLRPNYWESDFSLSFDFEEYNHRNFRLPLYTMYGDITSLLEKNRNFTEVDLNSKFCNLISSNPNANVRNTFFNLLNSQKRVDSGGGYLNNIGFNVQNKLQFIKEYRFTISFENSSFPGYTTEKIYEAMISGSIPIYWGNERIGEEFNTKSFINVHDYKNLNEAVEHVLDLENNPNMYRDLFSQPWVLPEIHKNYFEEERLLNFFDKYVLKKKKYVSNLKEKRRKIAAHISVTRKRIYSKILGKSYSSIQ